jgi:hypothetical protein
MSCMLGCERTISLLLIWRPCPLNEDDQGYDSFGRFLDLFSETGTVQFFLINLT